MLEPRKEGRPLFMRYECGCIGLVVQSDVDPNQRIVWCVSACDAQAFDDDPCLHDRSSLAMKPATDLTLEEKLELLRKLAGLIHDGHRFRALKQLLS
jgi:hypothetical protein